MQWFRPKVRTSIYGLLGHPVEPSVSMLDTGMEDIRQRMLELLGNAGSSRFPQVARRIRYASDLHGLWYLRGDLMAALASIEGEANARERVRRVTDLFQGLLPGSLASRPSPLVG